MDWHGANYSNSTTKLLTLKLTAVSAGVGMEYIFTRRWIRPSACDEGQTGHFRTWDDMCVNALPWIRQRTRYNLKTFDVILNDLNIGIISIIKMVNQ